MTEQRSTEWFEVRADRVTGSIAGAILGVNPWQTRSEILKQKLGYKKFDGNVATEYGNFHEEHALADFIIETGLDVTEVGFIVHKDHDWLGASPDGIIESENAVLEIKCPFGLRDNPDPVFKSIEDLPHYYAQVQIEMFCTGMTKCYFFQWNRFKSDLQIVKFDPGWIEDNFQEMYDFYVELQELKKNNDKDLIDKYELAQDEFNNAKEKLEEIKNKIIDLAKIRGVSLVGELSVKEVERKGAIDYKKVPELKNVDLERYRKKPSKYWKVG